MRVWRYGGRRPAAAVLLRNTFDLVWRPGVLDVHTTWPIYTKVEWLLLDEKKKHDRLRWCDRNSNTKYNKNRGNDGVSSRDCKQVDNDISLLKILLRNDTYTWTKSKVCYWNIVVAVDGGLRELRDARLTRLLTRYVILAADGGRLLPVVRPVGCYCASTNNSATSTC